MSVWVWVGWEAGVGGGKCEVGKGSDRSFSP